MVLAWAGLLKCTSYAQKRPGRPKKMWDEVLVDDRKESADLQNHSEL